MRQQGIRTDFSAHGFSPISRGFSRRLMVRAFTSEDNASMTPGLRRGALPRIGIHRRLVALSLALRRRFRFGLRLLHFGFDLAAPSPLCRRRAPAVGFRIPWCLSDPPETRVSVGLPGKATSSPAADLRGAPSSRLRESEFPAAGVLPGRARRRPAFRIHSESSAAYPSKNDRETSLQPRRIRKDPSTTPNPAGKACAR